MLNFNSNTLIIYYNRNWELFSIFFSFKSQNFFIFELINYELTDMVLRKNGSVILIAEQININPNNTFSNLLVISYNQNSNLNWIRIIPKRQNFRWALSPDNRLGLDTA